MVSKEKEKEIKDLKAKKPEKIANIKDKVKKEVKKIGKKDKHGKDISAATGETWRLIHDNARVIDLVSGDAFSVTTSPHEIFIGTEDECRAEIDRLDLNE